MSDNIQSEEFSFMWDYVQPSFIRYLPINGLPLSTRV